MKLRKDQRYTLYCIMLEEFENSKYANKIVQFMCHALENIFGDDQTENLYLLESLQEINKKTMLKHHAWVFKDEYGVITFTSFRKRSNFIRINVLKKCIEETSNF